MIRTAWLSWLVAALVCALSSCVRVHGKDPYAGDEGGDGGSNSGTGGGGRGGGGGPGTGAVSGGGVGGGGGGGVAGAAGVGGFGARGGADVAGGIGGMGGFSGAGIGGFSGTTAPSCRETVETTAGVTGLSSACFGCTCDMQPMATLSCNRRCWRLIDCVISSGCNSSDTICIRNACVGYLGGMQAYQEAAVLAVNVPILSCRSSCFYNDDPDAGL